MTPADGHSTEARRHRVGYGQTVLEPGEPLLAPTGQLRTLYQLSDPGLSELGLDELLEELLDRVRDAVQADTVAILLLDESRDELCARAARGIEEEVEQGVRIPIGRGFAGRIASERVPIYIKDVDHADIMNPILREKGIHSLLGVPLIVEGELIGVLHIGSLTPRTFDQRDLAVLQLAAARAAPAIERARLHTALEREHRIAVTLQRSLLPRRLDDIAGVSIAARYLPARDEVGGDWYDVMQLPQGRIAAAIGPGTMATATYAVLDADAQLVRCASAGHLPPVILSAAGVPRLAEVDPGPPLGALSYHRCPETDLELGEDEIMLLYTDGLVERPRIPLRTSLDLLVQSLTGAASAEDACLFAVDRLVPPRGPRDDIALIALHNRAIPDVLALTLPADPAMLSQVRRLLIRWLRKQHVD